MLKEDIRGDQPVFKDVFDETFVLVDKDDKSMWLKTMDVYPTFSCLNESEMNIKYMLSQLGVDCKKCRGPRGQAVYFRGLHWLSSFPSAP